MGDGARRVDAERGCTAIAAAKGRLCGPLYEKQTRTTNTRGLFQQFLTSQASVRSGLSCRPIDSTPDLAYHEATIV